MFSRPLMQQAKKVSTRFLSEQSNKQGNTNVDVGLGFFKSAALMYIGYNWCGGEEHIGSATRRNKRSADLLEVQRAEAELRLKQAQANEKSRGPQSPMP
ncbi:MAG: hypothetical protein ACHP65_08565 [Legionellales bacterium]